MAGQLNFNQILYLQGISQEDPYCFYEDLRNMSTGEVFPLQTRSAKRQYFAGFVGNLRKNTFFYLEPI